MSDSPKVLAVIPARYGSSRLAGKPLKTIGDKPMIELVYKRASEIESVDAVIVATDDQRIMDAVAAFGGVARMTSPDHRSGTDRVAEVAEQSDADIVVNLQGDEPFIDPASVNSAITALIDNPDVNVSTLCVPVTVEEADDPNVTLVVRDLKNRALYFSKLPIPNDRDGSASDRPVYKHLGIYIFRRDFLLQYAGLEQSPLEKLEKLEQLRILEHGYQILCVETEHDSIGVDSPDDLDNANKIYAKG